MCNFNEYLSIQFRAPKKASSSGNNATAIEAIEKIVQEKKISTKINYDVLRSLAGSTVSNINKTDDSGDTKKEDADSPGILAESPVDTPELRTSLFSPPSPTKTLRRIYNPTSDRKDSNILGLGNKSPKRKIQSTEISKIKRNKTLSSNSETFNEKGTIDNETTNNSDKSDRREVVIESGPVDSSTVSYEHEENDDEFEYDDEDIPQSAAELLSKHRGDDGTELSDWEEEYY